MTQTVTFPGLGLEFTLNRVAFTLGPINIYWYGVIITAGIALGVLYCYKRSREFGINPDKFLDITSFMIIGGIIGARIYFVAFSWDYYKDNLWAIFDMTAGGIAIYGGIIGGALVIAVLTRKYKINFFKLTDLIVGGLILGQAIGRWGNFMNVEAFGSNTSMPWGMASPSITTYLEAMKDSLALDGVIVDPSMPVHPTFFYESMWCLVGFILIMFYTKHRKFTGELTLIYIAWYGLGRFFIEGLRTDSLMFGAIRVSQALAGVCVIVAVILYFVIRKRVKALRMTETEDNENVTEQTEEEQNGTTD